MSKGKTQKGKIPVVEPVELAMKLGQRWGVESVIRPHYQRRRRRNDRRVRLRDALLRHAQGSFVVQLPHEALRKIMEVKQQAAAMRQSSTNLLNPTEVMKGVK